MTTQWIQTQRGRAVSLLNPTADDIDPGELACLLSRLNRFGGHTRCDLLPYTVAQHSVFVASLLPEELKLVGLLHDAHEAYMGLDMCKPLKWLLNSEKLRICERAWDSAVASRFGFDCNLFDNPLVKEADLIALATERRDLMADCDQEWEALPEPSVSRIQPLHAFEAQDLFLATLRRLVNNVATYRDLSGAVAELEIRKATNALN